MKNNLPTLPGYRVCDYLIVASPHEELAARIRKIRTDFAQTFKLEAETQGRPQLTLVRFSQYELMQERICNRLGQVTMGFPPFKVNLKDFGSFPAHTIYIQALSKLPLQQLVKSIRSGAQRLFKRDEENKPHFILEPHISIGRKLKPWQYEKGWLAYSQKHFTASFIVSGITLLRRGEDEPHFRPLRFFPLQNLPVLTKQAELF